jgi:hypothetical protein
MAKLVARLLSRHLSKIQNGLFKQRSGQHTIARNKYTKKLRNRQVKFLHFKKDLLYFFKSYIEFYVPRIFWAQMALAALVPFKGPKKSRFLGPPPLKCPELWIVPPQNHFVPHHINSRYINS